MKNVLLVILLVCCGCRGIFWNQKLKREATDYAVGQKFELVQDIGLSSSIGTDVLDALPLKKMRPNHMTLTAGTQIQITEVKFYNDVEGGRTIDVKARPTSGSYIGRRVVVYSISLHRRTGDPNEWVNANSYSFIDPAYLKRVK